VSGAGTLTTLIPRLLTREIISCVDIVVALEFPLFSAHELDHTKVYRKFENVAVKSSSPIVINLLQNAKLKCHSVSALLLAVQYALQIAFWINKRSTLDSPLESHPIRLESIQPPPLRTGILKIAYDIHNLYASGLCV